jgi:hypothetical protein
MKVKVVDRKQTSFLISGNPSERKPNWTKYKQSAGTNKDAWVVPGQKPQRYC